MIPPADSLLKYDTPVLVSRNTEKRSPKVRTSLRGWGSTKLRWGKTGAALKFGSPQGQRLKSLGVKDWDLRREREDHMLGDPKGQISMGKKVTGRCDKSF